MRSDIEHLNVEHVNIKHNVGRFLSHISRRMFKKMSEYLAPHNINFSHFTYLMALYREEGLTQQELSHQLYLDKATTARNLNAMEKAGLIERRVDPADKRVYRVYLTQQGNSLKDAALGVIYNINIDLTRGMTKDEIIFLMALLARVEQNLISQEDQNF